MVDLPGCCRGHLVTMMADMQQLLVAAGITWWIDYGTLLGAVRNPSLGYPPGIIPHDKDADAGFLAADVPKFRALGRDWKGVDVRPLGTIDAPSGPLHVIQKLPRPYDRRAGESAARYQDRVLYTAGCSFKVRWSPKNHTNIDFFWHNERDDPGGTSTLYRERYVSVDKYKGREFPASKLFPLTTIPWEGLMLPAPNDPEWFCWMRYGDSWRTPIRANNDKIPRNADGSVAGERQPMVG
jgi:hypothetical protein